MTPVEERIDHEEAKRIAEAVYERNRRVPHSSVVVIARAYLALLTEHFAREKALRKIAACWKPHSGLHDVLDSIAEIAHAALPATESAQPEEERQP